MIGTHCCAKILYGTLANVVSFGAGLVLAEYFKSNKVATVKEVNGEEPIFPNISFFNFRLRGSKVLVLISCF